MSGAVRWKPWLTRGLLALAVWRLAAILAAQPMLAVANNYDMIRVQACIDAYPVRAASISEAGNYAAARRRRR